MTTPNVEYRYVKLYGSYAVVQFADAGTGWTTEGNVVATADQLSWASKLTRLLNEARYTVESG